MRNTTEITRGYQIWYMIKRELIGVLACAFVQFVLFVGAYSNDVFRIISGILFSCVYFMLIYDGAAVLGKADNRSYTPLNVEVKWSFIWGIIIALINLGLMVIFKLNWYFGDPVSIWVNILFYVLRSPFYAFFIATPKNIPLFVWIISVSIPVLASVAGYVMGKNNFNLSDKMRGIMFEKDNKGT